MQTAMADLKLDVKKMPLGQLSKQQIARGFDCLDELEKAINDGASYAAPLLSCSVYCSSSIYSYSNLSNS